ncbi:MAG: acyl-CoA/acyl-ACP dehydrogenase [Verrucomicrobiales bacterium]|jgi:alkylation response protein AidB-like acyl-CoA dehydrogenase|nr:acyl-CoA/acyl-ACP dehydrogenase [Verrucomicrobiales bacterium]MBP9223821.1 acyl-CoA/acyl-ACP dehydrogenase [Verrucomicrobiales bacterium]
MYQLSPAQQVIVGKAKEIACSVLAEQAADVDEKSRFPVESMAALAEGGFYGLLIPAELGGMGGDLRLLAAVVDELAQACGSTAMIYMMHSAGVNCYLSHPDKFKGELLDCVAGKHLSTLAFSESGSRSEFWAPVSQAIASGDGVTLSASKSWVTSAGIADGIVASCNAPDGSGASVYLVKKGDTGLSISGGWSSLGMRGNQSNPMTLSDVTLPDETRLIGEAGKGGDIMLGTALPVFLICQGAIGVGLAESCFLAAQKHITSHGFQHTGKNLSDLPNLRASLSEMRLETDKARAYLVAVLAKFESSASDAMLHALAVKASSSEAAVRVSDLAMRACGGAAFSKHLGLERPFRDARAAIVMAPTTDHLREFVGRLLVGMPLFG